MVRMVRMVRMLSRYNIRTLRNCPSVGTSKKSYHASDERTNIHYRHEIHSILHLIFLFDQVFMTDSENNERNFTNLDLTIKELTMFTIDDLRLSKRGKLVEMEIVLKRKITTELLTTFLPTILLLLITFTSILFDKKLFGDSLAVNLTIMLVMTTIFTSKIEELPSTSDTKLIDIWLIGCLLVPFTEVVLRTIMEVLGHCEHCTRRKREKKRRGRKKVHKAKKNHRRKAWTDDKPTSGIVSPQVTQVVVTVNDR